MLGSSFHPTAGNTLHKSKRCSFPFSKSQETVAAPTDEIRKRDNVEIINTFLNIIILLQ
jgi:hypothetical protein